MAKIHTLQDGYQTGDLSVFPEAIDNKESLYEVSNNAVTKLRQSLTYSALTMVVDSTDNFPDKGVIKISDEFDSKNGELVYYDSKTSNTFKKLVRGFAGSIRSQWNINSSVSNAVSAEHHNSLKDAIIKIEVNLGLKKDPNQDSLNGILKKQENRFLITKPIFRAYPLKGSLPLTVTFQSFSTGPIVKYFWDFGDGNTSSEKNPVHTYYQEGTYTVELNVVGSMGGQGISTKNNYIVVSNEEKTPFFYVSPLSGNKYSESINENTTLFEFVDQTDGNVKERIWNFGGSGYLIKKLYEATIDNTDPTRTTIQINKKIIDLNTSYKCFIKGQIKNSIGSIIDIKYRSSGGNNYTDIIVDKVNQVSSVGFFQKEEITQYTELDPNIHFLYFVYTEEQKLSPSIFVLFKNQIIKKSFLKEEIIIQ
jgi:PKD repeat protein